jgi:putative ABC transport system permease protein
MTLSTAKRAGPRPGPAQWPALGRTVGTAFGGVLALALLTCGCVFAAVAGPAFSLHTRTQALHQTLAGLPDTTKTVQVNTTVAQVTGALQTGQVGQSPVALGEDALAQSTTDIARGLAAVPLPLAGGDWAGLSASQLPVAAGAARSAYAGQPPKMEVVYRDPFTRYMQLVAGSYSSGQVPAGAVTVVATEPTAARFGLHPGSRLTLTTRSGPATLIVTAIVRARDTGSTFWQQDTTIVRPSLEQLGPTNPPFWVGGVIADPDQFVAIQDVFGGVGLGVQWEFPLDVSGVNADQAQGLYQTLNRATTTTPTLTALAPAAGELVVTSPLLADLALFLGTQAAVETVLQLLFVSLIVVGAAVILLAARMIVDRREGELTMLRARGGSLGQVAGLMLRGAVLAAGPGVVLGVALAIAVVPGGASLAGWPLAAIAIAAALGGPPLIAVWRHRRPDPASNPALITSAETRRAAGPARSWRRLVIEVTAVAASVAGLVVLRNQGVPAGGSGTGTDLYLTITPVLVAIPVVVVMLRLYPLAIRGLLVLTAREAGATGFVALSRAARSSLTGALPAFALVLTLSVATFAAMVSQGISRGEAAASWHATGADVVIQPGQEGTPITPAAVRAIGAVPGVRHTTAVWVTNWSTPFGQPVTVIAVNPASYAAMTADTPFSAFPAARIGRDRSTAPGTVLLAGATVPVLASPSARAVLDQGTGQLNSPTAMPPLKVRVVGLLSDTPALPAGGPFVVMPLLSLPGPAGAAAPNLLLATGSAINQARLTAAANRTIPGNVIRFRSSVLAALASSPLQHGAGLIITLIIAAATALGLFIVILGLALGAGERGLTLARLTVMGHDQTTGLVMAEAMPAVIAAVIAGAVCAVALPRVIGSAIDLSAFTGSSAPVRLQLDALALGLPAAIIVVLALGVLAGQARALRRRDISGMLRAN